MNKKIFLVMGMLVALTLTQCKKNEEVYDDLTLSHSTLQVRENTSGEFKIETGSGDYAVTSSDESVVTAQLLDVSAGSATVKVNAHKKGEATLRVSDNLSGQHKTLQVNVTEQPTDVTIEHVNEIYQDVLVGETISLTITGGSGNYETFTKNKSAEVSISSGKLLIKGVKTDDNETVTILDLETRKSAAVQLRVWVIQDMVLPPTIEVQQNTERVVDIFQGSGDFELKSNSNQAIATASIEGTKLKITAKTIGETTLTIRDKRTSKEASTTLKVIANTGDDNNYKIVLTTKNAVGTDLYLAIGAAQEDRKNVWIDLNNNGIRDANESVKTFSNYSYTNVAYRIASQTITIYGKVTIFSCSSGWNSDKKNKISRLDVTKNSLLEKLDCGYNELETLDVSKNYELIWLDLSDNNIKTIDIKNNKKLEDFRCSENNITSLDLTNNTGLRELYCGGNKLKTLDITKNEQLWLLRCSNNEITSIKIGVNVLQDLIIHSNNINEAEMEKIISKLQTYPQTQPYYEFIPKTNKSGEKNVITQAQIDKVKAKKWNVVIDGVKQ